MRIRTRTWPAILVTVTSAVLGVSYLTRTGANDDPTTQKTDSHVDVLNLIVDFSHPALLNWVAHSRIPGVKQLFWLDMPGSLGHGHQSNWLPMADSCNLLFGGLIWWGGLFPPNREKSEEEKNIEMWFFYSLWIVFSWNFTTFRPLI